jgi:hypothetical protein
MDDAELHKALVASGQRALAHDLEPWLMLDADDEVVLTPCCASAEWLEPLLLSASCGVCLQRHEVAPLRIARGVQPA